MLDVDFVDELSGPGAKAYYSGRSRVNCDFASHCLPFGIQFLASFV